MHQLGDQWVEIIDGQEHVVKAVKITRNSWPVDNGFRDGYFFTNNKIVDEKYSYYEVIKAKDLGVLRDGCLPTPWDKELYPDFYNASKTLWCIHAESNDLEMKAVGNSKQEAKNAWNRRE